MGAKRKSKKEEFQPSGEINRIVSLGGGKFCYIFDHKGKTHHLPVGSVEMVEKCKEVEVELPGRITSRLEELGWTEVLEQMS